MEHACYMHSILTRALIKFIIITAVRVIFYCNSYLKSTCIHFRTYYGDAVVLIGSGFALDMMFFT